MKFDIDEFNRRYFILLSAKDIKAFPNKIFDVKKCMTNNSIITLTFILNNDKDITDVDKINFQDMRFLYIKTDDENNVENVIYADLYNEVSNKTYYKDTKKYELDISYKIYLENTDILFNAANKFLSRTNIPCSQENVEE